MAEPRTQRQVKPAEKAGELFYVAQREGARKIKLHEQQQEKAKSIDEAVVRTTSSHGRLPDMRFAENKNLYELDTSKTVNGQPDQRFVENRQDLLEIHRRRGDTRSNLIFTDDMIPEELPA